MIPILYETMTEGTVPTHYGLGPLTDCLRCEVSEERNGKYELVLEYTANGIHADDIQVNRFIMAKPNFTDNPQIFRIYKVSKTMNGKFTVNAQHISYDLSGKVISSGTAASCAAACLLLEASAGNFTITTDKTVSADFTIKEPSSVRSWFGGKQGSLLDVYGTAEWYYDNYSCALKLSRGQDRGVQIRYGKNLTELSQEIDMSNLCTGVIPYYIDDETNTKVVGAKVSTGLVLDVDRDQAVDFSSDVDPESATPIATQLATLATNYITNNIFTRVFSSITLDFVQMGSLKDRVDLCDTVHIFFEPLGISVALKCVATVWDVLQERYIQTTFGDSRNSIADTIVNQQQEIKNTVNTIQTVVDRATELITGNLGGYVVMHDTDADGKPNEILIMDTEDINTAVNVIRMNQAGIGLSTNGYAGPYDTAMTASGIVATMITTGVLNADLIKAGVIEDVNHNSQIDMTSGIATLTDMIAKKSFELVDSNSVRRGFFKYDALLGEPHLGITDADADILAEMWGNAYGGRFGVNDTSGNRRGFWGVGASGSGLLNLANSNGDYTVNLYGSTGEIELTNANGDMAFNFNSSTGHARAPKILDKVFDSPTALDSVGDWWTFDQFAMLVVVGRVKTTASYQTMFIPTEMLSTSPTRFQISDDTNWISFDIYIDSNDLIRIEFAGKNNTGYIHKVYGFF